MIENILQKKKGFSLVEMIIYTAIVSLMLFTLTSFIFTVLSQQNRIEAGSYLDSESRHIFTRLEAIIQNSTAIISPNPGQDDDTLEINVSDASKDPTGIYIQDNRIVIDEDGSSYFLTGENLVVSDFSVKNFSSYDAPEIVQIKFKLSVTNGSESNSFTTERNFTSSFALRQYD